jgi:hypothetical protein
MLAALGRAERIRRESVEALFSGHEDGFVSPYPNYKEILREADS